MTTNKTAVLAEVVARKAATPVASNDIVLRSDFPQQNAFVEDTSRYIAVQCSRRSGKSNGLAIRFFRTMARHPKSQCIYLALTLESAREILWPVLHEFNDRFQMGCTFTESKLTMKHPNGATLKLFGADQKNFIKRLKGRKYPGIGIDEAQDFSSHLQSLVDDVLTPSMADYADGWIALTGTPGPVPTGYYFEVTQNKKYGYSHHGWTILDNPYMPDPKAFLEDLKSKREWDNDNPTLRREWLNHWVLDENSLWIRYNKAINDYKELPKADWTYVLGIDVGFRDADAIAVIAWSDTLKETYLVDESIKAKQGLTELAEQIQHFEKKYPVSKMVIDEGGLGKKLAEELRRRHGIPVVAADKMRKQENVELLNDAMRLGRFKAKASSRFVEDSYKIQIDWDKSTPNRIIIKKQFHSDIIDSVLYGFKESYSYSSEPAKTAPAYGTKEWADAQTSSMFDAEMEGFMKEQEYNNWLKGQG